MAYCGYVTTLSEINKHSNADRLQCATVFGSNVIVDLSYFVGQRVVYFPVDGQLSAEFAEENNLLRKKDENGNNVGGYLDPDKRNIRAIKLRGEKSDGLVLPIEALAKYTDISKLQDVDQIAVLGGFEICRKYIPHRHPQGHGMDKQPRKVSRKELNREVAYPYFVEHKDTEQLAFNQRAFRPGDTIYITSKLHGTSMRVANTPEVTTRKRPAWVKKLFGVEDKITRVYKTVSGTRRIVLRSGFFGGNAFREKYNDMFVGKLPKGMEVYGEIVGWVNESTPIMPRCSNAKVKDREFSRRYGKETVFSYGCEPGENELYVYRITVSNEDGVATELPTEEVKRWCERLGVQYVPLLEKFLYTDWQDLNERYAKYLDVPEPLANGTHVREGVVVRIDNRSVFTAYKEKSFTFKVLEGIIKEEAAAPDMEEAEELL